MHRARCSTLHCTKGGAGRGGARAVAQCSPRWRGSSSPPSLAHPAHPPFCRVPTPTCVCFPCSAPPVDNLCLLPPGMCPPPPGPPAACSCCPRTWGRTSCSSGRAATTAACTTLRWSAGCSGGRWALGVGRLHVWGGVNGSMGLDGGCGHGVRSGERVGGDVDNRRAFGWASPSGTLAQAQAQPGRDPI